MIAHYYRIHNTCAIHQSRSPSRFLGICRELKKLKLCWYSKSQKYRHTNLLQPKYIPGIPSSFGQHVLADQSYCSFSYYCYQNHVFLFWICAPLVSFHFQALLAATAQAGFGAVSPDKEQVSSTAESLIYKTGWFVAGWRCSTSNSSA